MPTFILVLLIVALSGFQTINGIPMEHHDLPTGKEGFGEPLPEHFIYDYGEAHQPDSHYSLPQWGAIPAQSGTYTNMYTGLPQWGLLPPQSSTYTNTHMEYPYKQFYGNAPETFHRGDASTSSFAPIPQGAFAIDNAHQLHPRWPEMNLHVQAEQGSSSSANQAYHPADPIANNFYTQIPSSQQLDDRQERGEHESMQEDRPEKLRKYQWQKTLDVEVLMKMYGRLSRIWGPKARATYRDMFAKLNRELALDPSLLQGVLENNANANEEACKRAGPTRASSKEIKTLMNTEQFLQWIWNDNPKNQNTESTKWTLHSAIDAEDLKILVNVLAYFWKMTAHEARKRLRTVDPSTFERYSPLLLNYKFEDKWTLANAANMLLQATKDGGHHSKQSSELTEQEHVEDQPGEINVSDYEIDEPYILHP